MPSWRRGGSGRRGGWESRSEDEAEAVAVFAG